jgi:hypothetical protein
LDAVDALTAEDGPGPDVAVDIGAYAIVERARSEGGRAPVQLGKYPPVGELAAVVLNIPGDDLRLLIGKMSWSGICDVEDAVVRREAEAIRFLDLVRKFGDCAVLGAQERRCVVSVTASWST